MLSISKDEIIKRLQFDNIWWEDNKIDNNITKKPKRLYFQDFYKNIIDKSINRALVLMGPRRVGKTIIVYQSIYELISKNNTPRQNILYLSLETPIYTGIGLEQLLNLFIDLYKHKRNDDLFIFFDEIQYLKDWSVHLKSLVDSYPSYKFIVTGSAAAALKLKSNESGAGRFSDYILPPLTFYEYLNFTHPNHDIINDKKEKNFGEQNIDNLVFNIQKLNEEFINYLNYGGYPEAVFSDKIRQEPTQYIKNDIIDKVLLRDLPSLYGISDIQELNRLFNTLAYNTGNEISLDELSKNSGVAKNTIKRYLEYLEAAFLIKTINKIDDTAKHFKRATRFKIYLTNPSMRSALFGEVDDTSSAIGHIVETAIFSQWQHRLNLQLYYARWIKGEIDMVRMSKLDKIDWFVEIKWTDRPYNHNQELNNCIEFKEKNTNKINYKGPIIITSKTILDKIQYRNSDFRFIPSSLYAYIISFNTSLGYQNND